MILLATDPAEGLLLIHCPCGSEGIEEHRGDFNPRQTEQGEDINIFGCRSGPMGEHQGDFD